ncbi:MAG: hypothetical protein EP330_16435 [Deltaproteobacteria bacterium]|nr:MAG: hypothetical protein EP330_16435 [Deltaproteobacteria bacterium]
MPHVVPVEELTALARAIALDAGLEIQVGQPGSGWFINPKTGIINVDGGDLAKEDPDDVRGLICHEAAHAAVTRYLTLVPEKTLKQPGIASLMNSLEDCRIEDWIVARFPGASAWVDLYNDRLFPESGKGLGEQPFFQQFCLGAIHEWWHGELPDTLHPTPRQALDDTRDARERIVGAQPPHDAEIDLMASLTYDRHPVARVFRGSDTFIPPDPFERLVRLSAYEAYRITWLEVRPVYLELIRQDKANAGKMKEQEQKFLQQIRELRFGAPPKGAKGRSVRIPPHLVPPALRGEMGDPPDPEMMDGEPLELAELSEEMREMLERLAQSQPENQYEEARNDVMPYADAMVAHLERVLRPTSYPRWLNGYASGNRVDLRVAMHLEVEAGAYTRMWQRKTLPAKRDPAFLVFLDLSGSMNGERIHHGFRGVVLCCEVLERLQIPFAVHGFQDQVVPFKDFATPLDKAMREVIGTMPAEVRGNRKGGHNRPQHNWDGPCLLRAAEMLEAYPAHERMLLLISDGEPSGPSDADGALKRAVAKVRSSYDIHLVGIGLGPGTDHVNKYYPDAIANVSLERFPQLLGETIDRLVLSDTPMSARALRGART